MNARQNAQPHLPAFGGQKPHWFRRFGKDETIDTISIDIRDGILYFRAYQKVAFQ
ncbi:MAG: hypothetical protein LLG97_06390 [Deltaproteobacteria bacterium]|nr:hypothetical protein [Deltaproteobacteria bacterium]